MVAFVEYGRIRYVYSYSMDPPQVVVRKEAAREIPQPRLLHCLDFSVFVWIPLPPFRGRLILWKYSQRLSKTTISKVLPPQKNCVCSGITLFV